jgi:hypothetical protein
MATLKEMVPTLLNYVRAYQAYLEHNAVLLDVYNGNLLPLIDKALAPPTFSKEYYERIRERIVAINVLKRISDKSARAYVSRPDRVAPEKYSQDVAFYEEELCLDANMQLSDIYSQLFKGYALEPFVHKGKPKLRVLPFDRFLPYSDDAVDGTSMTAFIKFMGKRTKGSGDKARTVEVFHAYTDSEFYSFDSDGDTVTADFEGNDGVNPYGVIPFVYGNRGNDVLLPTQDTDTLSLTKMIPVLLTDLSGAIMFQCFSIVYGINVDSKNLTMSPNAFWDLKSDNVSQLGSGSAPSVGSIKPEANITEVIQYIMTIFSFWLETRGIRVGGMGSADAGNVSSGIAKMIDEMDATELIQKSQEAFRRDEQAFWSLLKTMNNYWVSNAQINGVYIPGLWKEDFAVVTAFDPPTPGVDRQTEVATVKMERDAGFISTRKAIEQLYPDLTPEQVDEQMEEANGDRGGMPSMGDAKTLEDPEDTAEPDAEDTTAPEAGT